MTGRFLALALALASAVTAQARPLTIYWVDVEGGGATLIVTPAGESVLIDTGENLERDASRIFEVASKHAGLKAIDHVILTHWHDDHYGGVERLSQLIPLKRFYDHGIPATLVENPASFERLMPLYKKVSAGKTRSLKPGAFVPLKDSTVALQCVAGNKQVAKARNAPSGANKPCAGIIAAEPDKTDNANSLAFKLTFGKFTFFDGGDLTRDIEQKLACPANLVGPVTVYQTNSHGMDVSNDAHFLRALQPRVAVVNNGPKKGAEPQTMKTLFSTPGIETIWQGHQNLHNGGIRNTDPEFIANHELKCSARFIKATVEPEGGFTMQIDASGTPKSYKYR